MRNEHIREAIVDFIDGTLSKEGMEEIQYHLHECEQCRQEYLDYKKILSSLNDEKISIPVGFIDRVKTKIELSHNSKQTRMKRYSILSLLSVLFLTLFVSTAIAMNRMDFSDWWNLFTAEQHAKVDDYIEKGYGESLNLVAEEKGIEITIKSIVADDLGTHLYYEIEDTKENQLYMIDFIDGINIQNQDQFWEQRDEPDFRPFNGSMNLTLENSKKFSGKITMMPLDKENGILDVRIDKLELFRLGGEPSEVSYFEGEWHFEVPVEKLSSYVSPVYVQTEIDGNPITIKELIIAPTKTDITYNFSDGSSEGDALFVHFGQLEADGKELGQLPLLESRGNPDYESIYPQEAKNFKLHVHGIHYFYEKKYKYVIDYDKGFPQTFNYMGNQITIEKVEAGNPTKIVVAGQFTRERNFERLHLEFGYDLENVSVSGQSDGKVVDANGDIYEADMMYTNALENPIFYTTVTEYELTNELLGKNVKPEYIEIEGYTKTKLVDQVIQFTIN